MGQIKKAYHAPQFIDWGSVTELTQGTGKTQYTDGTPCTNPGGVTFYGSSDASFCRD